ncbi:cytochrome-c oxidase, cbb3-type subunit II [Magnetofaba australis]|uniref:Putative FixO2 cytochrome c oxidase subunit n=1 Tax=Magnetofaba australis IT-1 TaxID=1434232 RepID=A0A1Y2K4I5_9PROT|nr:cytochrome-c oxidase, cbb3-type subunit II [Magnetofaba australis]OSM02556.1 putative FixO2 cytochrome c oxidase subunit [Magnetofaba australis IT-1]
MNHAIIEKNIPLLAILTTIVISIGAIVEIFPLFWIEKTVEKVEGIRPYTPLELRGRDIYIREGCYNCHSQMIRPFRDEVERYGHYSLAAESQYDHPFQWGSKRTGPDLARVGGKYSNKWHREHMRNPQKVVPESVMPQYPWLESTPLAYGNIKKRLEVMKIVGVPYTKEMIDNAKTDLMAQANPDADADGLQARYSEQFKSPEIRQEDFAGDGAGSITELDALVAYLQMLGTLVDFSKVEGFDAETGVAKIEQY